MTLAVSAVLVILVRGGGPWDQKLIGMVCAAFFWGIPGSLLGAVLGALVGALGATR